MEPKNIKNLSKMRAQKKMHFETSTSEIEYSAGVPQFAPVKAGYLQNYQKNRNCTALQVRKTAGEVQCKVKCKVKCK